MRIRNQMIDAMEAHGEATQSQINLLKTRIDYETREGAKAEELAQADRDRAQAMALIRTRQQELADTATASRDAIETMRAAQVKVNRSTQEGNALWEDLENKINRLMKLAGTKQNPMGDLSEQWWKLQGEWVELSEKNNAASTKMLRDLSDLKSSYEKGTTPLADYVAALAKLEQQAGLTDKALKSLNEEQGAAITKLWNKQIEDAIDKQDQALKKFGADLDSVFNGISKASSQADSATMTNTLRGALNSLSGAVPAKTHLLAGATATTEGLLKDILGGKYAINADTLAKMDRSQFLSAVQTASQDLIKAGQTVNGLLISIANERDAVIKSIEAQITPINDVLKKFDVLDKADKSKEARSSMLTSLGKLTGVNVKAPVLPKVSDVTRLAGSVRDLFKVDDLGKLTPEKFAQVLSTDLSRLRTASTTAKAYLEAATRSFDEQIKSIDAGLKATLNDLQVQLDKMDAEDQASEREKATKEHNDRLLELQRQHNELALKTDLESSFQLASVDQQIAEENQKWSEQQTQWQRDDRRTQIRDQMKAEQEKADKQKQALEDQKQLYLNALNDITSYINGEIGSLKELAQERVNNLNTLKTETTDQYNTLLTALGDVKTYVDNSIGEWQRLSDERKRIEDETWNDEKTGIRAVMNNGITGLLADMAAKDPEFMARGQSMVQAVIDGINSKKSDLQQALDDLNRTTAQYQSAKSTLDAVQQASSLAKEGKLDAAASVLSKATGLTTEQAKANIQSQLPKFANEAFVPPTPGGLIANIAEGGVGEYVLREDRLQARIDSAVLRSMNYVRSPAPTFTDILAVISREIGKITLGPFYGVVDVRMSDGSVQRTIVELFQGLPQLAKGT
jgi:hypothetical protein